jgi:hypothetical protein
VLGYYVATSLPTDTSEETMKNALHGYNDPKFLASVADELKIEDCLQYQLVNVVKPYQSLHSRNNIFNHPLLLAAS